MMILSRNRLFAVGMVIFFLSSTLLFLFTIPVTATDADNDGLNDEWESEHGLDPSDPSDGTNAISDEYGQDADGDGIIDDQASKVKERYKQPLFEAFAATFLLALALLLLILGIFAAYYGKKFTRARAAILGLIGVMVLLAFVIVKVLKGRIFDFVNWHLVDITLAFVTSLGAVLGLLIATLAFYYTIMR